MSSILAQRASASISPFVYPSINCTDLLVYLYLVENLFYYSPNEKKKLPTTGYEGEGCCLSIPASIFPFLQLLLACCESCSNEI